MSDTQPTVQPLTDEQFAARLDDWLNGFKTGIESTLVNVGGYPQDEAHELAMYRAHVVTTDTGLQERLRAHMDAAAQGTPLPGEEYLSRHHPHEG